MKIVIYANVTIDWKGIIHMPHGISQFRSYINRNFITSDAPYTHPSAKAVEGDLIIWAFRDESEDWHLLGEGFVVAKFKEEGDEFWSYSIDGARLYPHSVSLEELSFFEKVKRALNIGYELSWKEYVEILRNAATPLAD